MPYLQAQVSHLSVIRDPLSTSLINFIPIESISGIRSIYSGAIQDQDARAIWKCHRQTTIPRLLGYMERSRLSERRYERLLGYSSS
jgi:hypothetical protein